MYHVEFSFLSCKYGFTWSFVSSKLTTLDLTPLEGHKKRCFWKLFKSAQANGTNPFSSTGMTMSSGTATVFVTWWRTWPPRNRCDLSATFDTWPTSHLVGCLHHMPGRKLHAQLEDQCYFYMKTLCSVFVWDLKMDVDFKWLFCLLTTCDRIKSSVCEKWMEAIVFVSSKSSEHSF